jgi:hypothetical protein
MNIQEIDDLTGRRITSLANMPKGQIVIVRASDGKERKIQVIK